MRAHALSNVLSFSSTPLSGKLSYASFVFDSLTTTKSATTPSASKAGLFYELQYDTSTSMNPTLIGGKLLDHRLERSRVASVPTGERNFHILYYLIAGTSGAEKNHLGLNNPGNVSSDAGNRTSTVGKRWRYLGHPTQLKVGINDAEAFQDFKTALRKLEFPRQDIAEICQVLAAILHLGQLDFGSEKSTTPQADDSGGYSHEGGEDMTVVKNRDELVAVAAFLGLTPVDLERSLGHKSKTIFRERVTVMLDPRGARGNADELARTLYTLLVAYVIETINQKICAPEDQVANTISIVDFPGFAPQSSTGYTLDQLLNNAANEGLYNFCLDSFFQHPADLLESEDVAIPATKYYDNSDAVKGLLKQNNGLLTILDDQMRRGKTDLQLVETLYKRFEGRNPAIEVSTPHIIAPGTNFSTPNAAAFFKIKHYAGEVDYPAEGLMEQNAEVISGDLLNLIKNTNSTFIRDLFGQDVLNTVSHPKEKSAIVQASVSSKPTRMPSMSRKKHQQLQRSGTKRQLFGQDEDALSEVSEEGFGKESGKLKRNKSQVGVEQGVSAQYLSSLTRLIKSLNAQNMNPYFIFCLKPNDRRIANQFDSKCIRAQVQTFGIAEISQRLRNADFSLFLPFSEFLGLAETETVIVGSDGEKAEMILDERRWPGNEARVGTTGVFLSERVWLEISNLPSLPVPGAQSRFMGAGSSGDEDGGDPFLTPNRGYGDSKLRLIDSQTPTPGSYYHDAKGAEYFGSKELDLRSEAGVSALNGGDMFRGLETKEQMAEKTQDSKMEAVDEVQTSGSRKRWLFMVYMMTFFIPDFLIKWIGRMKRKDVRIAWREKLAINMIIWLSCAFVVFFMSKSRRQRCCRPRMLTQVQLASRNSSAPRNMCTHKQNCPVTMARTATAPMWRCVVLCTISELSCLPTTRVLSLIRR